jgi:hypothetical protein
MFVVFGPSGIACACVEVSRRTCGRAPCGPAPCGPANEDPLTPPGPEGSNGTGVDVWRGLILTQEKAPFCASCLIREST